jgi:hypothetical protein
VKEFIGRWTPVMVRVYGENATTAVRLEVCKPLISEMLYYAIILAEIYREFGFYPWSVFIIFLSYDRSRYQRTDNGHRCGSKQQLVQL